MLQRIELAAPSNSVDEILRELDRIAKILRTSRGPNNLHPDQASALHFLQRNSGACVGDYARARGITHGPASRSLAALRRKGYAVASKDKNDRRGMRYQITAGGRAALKASDPASSIRRDLSNLSAPQQAAFLSLLARIRSEAQSVCGEGEHA